MNKEEKIKLRIEKLKAQSDFHKWEYGQYTTYLIGILAILIAIFIPATLEIPDITYKLLSAFLLIVLCFISYLVIKSFSKKSSSKIIGLSRQIEENYNKLEKTN